METEPAPVGAAEGQPAEAPSRDERAPAADTGRQERSDREASERTPVIHPALQVLLGMLVYALVVVAAPMYRALPPIRPELVFLLFLIPLHLGCGMAVGRRWASIVPLVGAVALLLAGIGGLTGSALFALLVATAAITAGVYLREILDRARLGRDGRWPLSTMIAGGLLAFSLIPGLWSLIQQLRPPERRPAAPQRVDERDATFLGVGLGDSARDVVRVFGRPQPRGETTPAPTMDAEQVGTPPVFRRPDPGEGPAPPVVGYRYPGRATFLLSGGRVYAFTVTVPTAESVRGVGIGDGLERVRQAYPDARCSVDPPASTLLGAPYCLVPLSAGRIMRFGQNPIASIAVSATPLR